MSRAERRADRRPRVAAAVGASHVEAALDALELLELAWHDCYGEISPSDDVIDQILTVSRGDLAELVRACRLAVTDRRDLALRADEIGGSQ